MFGQGIWLQNVICRLRRGMVGAFVLLAFGLNILLWTGTRSMVPLWPNVPPSPPLALAALSGLGDRELSYRLLAYNLQEFGNEGGRSTALYQYNYDRLGTWFMVLHQLDPVSNYAPYLAAYYFAATQRPKEQLGPIIDYLEVAGKTPEGYKKWRWLSQAVYQAYHRMGDHPRGIKLAEELAALPGDLPPWARQMPAILRADMGDRETALRMAMSMLVDMTSDKAMTPDKAAEISFTVNFICTRLQTPAEARVNPVCQNPELTK